MAKKKKDSSLGLGDIPFGGIFKMIDSFGDLAHGYVKQKAKVEERIDDIKEDTEKKLEELRQEAVKTAYEAKKALLRTIIEAILLSTGILSLVVGLIILVGTFVPLYLVLIGYGLLVTLIVLVQMKTSPTN